MGLQELQITVLGATGTGKTTLLTAMYEQFENTIKDVDLELTPDDETSWTLQEKLIELKSCLRVFESKGRVGLEGTEELSGPGTLPPFKFGLGKKHKSPSLQLSFRDYPGDYHAKDATKEERAYVNTILKQSAAVLIPIDAPALMEEKGRYHEELNRPQQIKDIFKASYKGLDSPKLVIFAPVKCEKYLQDETAARELSRRVSEEYKGLLEYLKSEGLRPWIASVITPVQTVGGLIFSRIEPDKDGIPEFYFRQIRHGAEYNPKDSEQPLRYLLSFLLKLHLYQRNSGFFSFIRDWIGSDEHLKQAVMKFSRGCKDTDGFTVLAGKKWLS